MGKCLVVVNKCSGRCKSVNEEKIVRAIGYESGIDYTYDKPHNNMSGYSDIVVIGGDGTLNGVINSLPDKALNIFYSPTGTLNDYSRTLKREAKQNTVPFDLGYANDIAFNYVFAAGSFTDIGYNTNEKLKHKLKRFAYFLQAFKSYKPHRIFAEITCGKEKIKGEYTLIMYIKSAYCFGLPFNKLYSVEKPKGQLILINSPKRGLFASFSMFFPFFRVFFCGLRREIEGRHITVCSMDSLLLKIFDKTDFCLDGEKYTFDGNIFLRIERTKSGIRLL